MYIQRAIEDRIRTASEQFPVILVTGPRQVGKTTLLKHLCGGKRRYVTFDDLTLRALANEDPVLFLQRYPPPVLIDEIQYAPGLLPYIKMAVDDSGLQGSFWLTGSQHFHMMKGISESLAGRVAIVNLLGLSRREITGRDIHIDPFLPSSSLLKIRMKDAVPETIETVYRKIWLGAFPALHTGVVKEREVFYRSYLQTYIMRDVHDLTRVGDEERFVRFVRACAARTGQMLNVAELARDVDISAPTAKAWLSILTATFQIALLQPYHTNITRRLVKTPKLYFLDTGFCSYLTEWTSPETLAAGAMGGAIFETYVFSELLKSWWHRMRSPNLYYYRDKDCREIDLIFEQDQTLYPVEIKRNATVQRQWARLFSMLDRMPRQVDYGGVICLCKEEVPLSDKISALPLSCL